MQEDWEKTQIEILEMKTVVIEINNKIKPQGMLWIVDEPSTL